MAKTPQQLFGSMIRSGQCPTTSRTPQDYCSHMRTPSWILGCAVSMLKQYFGSADRIALESATFLWDREPARSKLYVGDDFNWDFAEVGKRPAVIAELGGYTNISQIPTIGRSGMTGYNPETGQINYSSIEKGQLNFRCLAKQKLECWALAWEVKCFLQSYSDAIKETYNFKEFQISGVDPPTPLKEYEEYKVATVKLPFSLIDAWGIKTENLKVQTIDPTFSLDVEGETFFKDQEPG